MKKLIAYLTIYGLVLHLFNGCQSARYITNDELRNFNEDNDIIITTTDNKEYTLRRDSSYQNFSDWTFIDDKIEVTETKLIQQNDRNSRKLTAIKTEINANDLANIGVMEFDGLKTTLFVVGILTVVIGIGLLTYEGPDFSPMFQ